MEPLDRCDKDSIDRQRKYNLSPLEISILNLLMSINSIRLTGREIGDAYRSTSRVEVYSAISNMLEHELIKSSSDRPLKYFYSGLDLKLNH